MKLLLSLVSFFWASLSYSQTLSNFSLNGYADASMSVRRDSFSFSVGEFAPLIQFRYGDKILFRSGLIFKLAEDRSTRTELNSFLFDLVLNDNLVLEIGKFPSPFGQFRQFLRPSWINILPTQPVGFSDDLSVAPLRGIGLQLKGAYYLSSAKLIFSLFASNGPELVNSVGQVVVSDEDKNTDSNLSKLVGARVGISPIPILEVSVSGGVSKIGMGTSQNREYRIIGSDFVFRDGLSWVIPGLGLRGEYIKSIIDLTEDAQRVESAWYVEPSCFIPPFKLQPAFRYGEFRSRTTGDSSLGLPGSQTGNQIRPNKKRSSFGLNWIYHPSVILKAAYGVEYTQGKNSKTSIIAQIVAGF